jgi:2-dehydropantoate 2-reductase
MKIAIIGAGRMGSAFAWYLSRAGHEVTLVARGERLAKLQQDGAIVSVDGVSAKVEAAAALDTTVEWDGVLVTVLAHQVAPLLPVLKESKAKSIVYLFNTVQALQPLRDAVGAERAVVGFPTGFVLLVDGKLKATFNGPGQEIAVDSQAWAEVFRAAKLKTIVVQDMESFLRTHAAFVIPLMASGVLVYGRGSGTTWSESRTYARALKEGVAIVLRLGNTLVPSNIAFLVKLPVAVLTLAIFLMNKTQVQRDFGSFGPGEVRELIDGMQALAPGAAPAMLSIRP